MMKTVRQVISDFARKAGVHSVTFTSWDFTGISSAQACDAVRDYFSGSIPSETIDVEGYRILSPDDLLMENKELIPGCHAAPHGFFTFAATDAGDAFSVDVRTGAVHLLGVDKFEDGQIALGWKPDYSGFLDPIPITRDNILFASDCCWPGILDALLSLWESASKE